MMSVLPGIASDPARQLRTGLRRRESSSQRRAKSTRESSRKKHLKKKEQGPSPAQKLCRPYFPEKFGFDLD
jgi:hypothetical protein